MTRNIASQSRTSVYSTFGDSDGALVRSFSRAFERVCIARTVPRLTELHERTGALARRMHTAGFTPQESLILLKHAVHGHAGWRPSLVVAHSE